MHFIQPKVHRWCWEIIFVWHFETSNNLLKMETLFSEVHERWLGMCIYISLYDCVYEFKKKGRRQFCHAVKKTVSKDAIGGMAWSEKIKTKYDPSFIASSGSNPDLGRAGLWRWVTDACWGWKSSAGVRLCSTELGCEGWATDAVLGLKELTLSLPSTYYALYYYYYSISSTLRPFMQPGACHVLNVFLQHARNNVGHISYKYKKQNED